MQRHRVAHQRAIGRIERVHRDLEQPDHGNRPCQARRIGNADECAHSHRARTHDPGPPPSPAGPGKVAPTPHKRLDHEPCDGGR